MPFKSTDGLSRIVTEDQRDSNFREALCTKREIGRAHV